MKRSVVRFCNFFQLSRFFLKPIAAGPLSAKRYGLSHSCDGCYWVRADPVRLLADHKQVFMQGYSGTELGKEQIEPLLNTLNNFLAQDGIEIIYLTPKEWLLKCKPGSVAIPKKGNPKTTWHSVIDSINKDVHLFLPSGDNQSYWRRLFTECQMIMQNNENNSLWFWGGGVSQ